MVDGITVRLAGMKALVVIKHNVETVSVAQGKQMLHGDIRKTWISPEQ